MKTMMSIVLTVISLASASAFAVGDAGCGLGSVVISKNSKGLQILAMTTNATFLSQFFGITSGTSNCNSNGLVKNESQIQYFVEVNQEDLSKEMAQGHGEKLTVLAGMNGCGSPEAQKAFSSMTQKSFENIVTSSQVKSQEIVNNLKKEMEKDSATSHLCQVAAL
jgi:hypothetical protein